MNNDLLNRLSYIVDLRLPGFEKSIPVGKVTHMALEKKNSQEWFDEFANIILASIGKRYLPIFRVSDGEFYFSVGYRIPYPKPGKNIFIHYIHQTISYIRWSKYKKFRSGTPLNSFEIYQGKEWKILQEHYKKCLSNIVNKGGLLCMNFLKTSDRFGEEYHKDICSWFDKNKISITKQNYYPLYFVYALLNGPFRDKILKNKHILIITSLTPEKQSAIKRGYESLGAASIQFIAISESKGLTSKIDLNSIIKPIDVVLIGAGVGAANILDQLVELNTLCIDAGYCIDLVAKPELKGTRDFTVTDEDLNLK